MRLDEIPLSWAFGALVVMLALSAYFSIAETAMMAINRYRLKHMVADLMLDKQALQAVLSKKW